MGVAHGWEVVRDAVAVVAPGDQACLGLSLGLGPDGGVGSSSVVVACKARCAQQQHRDAYWTVPNNLFRTFLLNELECEMQKDIETILGWERGAEAI